MHKARKAILKRKEVQCMAACRQAMLLLSDLFHTPILK